MSIIGTIRWRLKPLRFIQKKIRYVTSKRPSMTLDHTSDSIANGFFSNPNYVTELNIQEILIDRPQIEADHQPFYNIYDRNSKICKELLSRLVDKTEIISILRSYFEGAYVKCWNISLNYSPERNSSATINESQLWHWDYSDKKMIHLMLYLTDVNEESGPFTYLDKANSELVTRNPYWIERYDDDSINSILNGNLKKLTNKMLCKRGTCFVADPGVFLHQGARNTKERIVLFCSFTTDFPYEQEPRFQALRRNDEYFSNLEKIINGN